MKNWIFGIIMIAVALLLFVAGFILLPGRVSLQAADGTPAVYAIPKFFALALPLLITGIGCFRFFRKEQEWNLLISAAGIASAVLVLMVNI